VRVDLRGRLRLRVGTAFFLERDRRWAALDSDVALDDRAFGDGDRVSGETTVTRAVPAISTRCSPITSPSTVPAITMSVALIVPFQRPPSARVSGPLMSQSPSIVPQNTYEPLPWIVPTILVPGAT